MNELFKSSSTHKKRISYVIIFFPSLRGVKRRICSNRVCNIIQKTIRKGHYYTGTGSPSSGAKILGDDKVKDDVLN